MFFVMTEIILYGNFNIKKLLKDLLDVIKLFMFRGI